jgi:hypothetical protein
MFLCICLSAIGAKGYVVGAGSGYAPVVKARYALQNYPTPVCLNIKKRKM